MGVASLAACVGWLRFRKQQIHFVASQMKPDLKRNWAFGKWALANHLLGELMTYASPWLVASVWGESETGMLAAATTIVGLSYPFVSGLGNFLGPRAAIEFSRRRPEVLVRLLMRLCGCLRHHARRILSRHCSIWQRFGRRDLWRSIPWNRGDHNRLGSDRPGQESSDDRRHWTLGDRAALGKPRRRGLHDCRNDCGRAFVYGPFRAAGLCRQPVERHRRWHDRRHIRAVR